MILEKSTLKSNLGHFGLLETIEKAFEILCSPWNTIGKYYNLDAQSSQAAVPTANYKSTFLISITRIKQNHNDRPLLMIRCKHCINYFHRYVMPVKLKCRKDELWKENNTMTEYYGRRVECRDETDIFSADVFPCFQVAMMKKYSRGKKPVISLNELKISQAVEGYVELIPDMKAIQYYVRGRGEKHRGQCRDMLREIEAMIDRELENRSPGTCTTKKYLSSSQVKNLKDLHNVRSYTMEQLTEAIQKDGVVHERKTHNTDEVAAIICKGFDMVFLETLGLNCKLEWGMTKQAEQALAEALDGVSCWRDDYHGLAEACMISDSVLDQLVQKRSKTSITLAILQKWCEAEEGHTVGDLLHILSTPGLVDNHRAKTAIIRMLWIAGHDVQVFNFLFIFKVLISLEISLWFWYQ